MNRARTGVIAGLIAVTVTTAVNIAARVIGLLPEEMDMNNMSEWIIDAGESPTAAFVAGVIIHIISGGLVGFVYTRLFKRWTPGTGMLFMLGGWLVMMLVLFPLTGRGFFGLDIGPAMPAATFILSMLYGAVIGALARKIGAG